MNRGYGVRCYIGCYIGVEVHACGIGLERVREGSEIKMRMLTFSANSASVWVIFVVQRISMI